MVTVKIVRNGNLIKKMEIAGHAGSAKYGKDLVCAGVSSIAIGLLNAIDILQENCCDLQIENENHITIELLENNDTIQTILKVGEIQFKTMEESYPKNIKIEYTEE